MRYRPHLRAEGSRKLHGVVAESPNPNDSHLLARSTSVLVQGREYRQATTQQRSCLFSRQRILIKSHSVVSSDSYLNQSQRHATHRNLEYKAPIHTDEIRVAPLCPGSVRPVAVIRIDEAANAVILMPAHAVPALPARPDLRATPDDVPDLDPGDAGSDALRGAADFVPDD